MTPAESAPESSGATTLLSIGELAERTGAATSALRYYGELGLARPVGRASGRRRYAEAAVAEVRVILFLQTVGFSLSEIGVLMTGDKRGSWQEIVDHKMAELAEQEQRLKMARAALEHARQCRTGDPARCPRFWSIIGYSDLTGPNNRCHSWEGRARSPNMSTDRAEIGVTTG